MLRRSRSSSLLIPATRGLASWNFEIVESTSVWAWWKAAGETKVLWLFASSPRCTRRNANCAAWLLGMFISRSEERRVGKECRFGFSLDHVDEHRDGNEGLG